MSSSRDRLVKWLWIPVVLLVFAFVILVVLGAGKVAPHLHPRLRPIAVDPMTVIGVGAVIVAVTILVVIVVDAHKTPSLGRHPRRGTYNAGDGGDATLAGGSGIGGPHSDHDSDSSDAGGGDGGD